MPPLNDLTGKKFGKLLVIGQNGRNADNRVLWLCKCDCGAIVSKTWKFFKKQKELWCGDNHPTKVCTSCKVEKNKELDYHKYKIGTNHINPRCKECIAKWYQENKEVLKEEYRIKMKNPANRARKREIINKSRNKPENKKREYEQKKIYSKRKEVRDRENEVHRRRKLTDMNYNIKRRLRWRIRDVFKDLGLDGKKYKYKSSILLLGCDVIFFKSYIESKFTEGMCWDRISEIHIDHIKPCSRFDLTKLEEQKKCFHYTNLQPLWWMDNLSKNASYDGD